MKFVPLWIVLFVMGVGVVLLAPAGASPKCPPNSNNPHCPETTTTTTEPPPTTEPPAEPAPIAGQGYHVVFSDDFDTFDTAVWDKDLWWKTSPADSVSAENGILHLRSRRSEGYQDAGVSTATPGGPQHLGFTQGYFEARMSWTITPGAWPAFWMGSMHHMDDESFCPNTELDIFEGQGDEPNTFYGTAHRDTLSRCVGDDTNQGWVQVPSMVGFHVYAALWTAGRICWYLDDLPATPCTTKNAGWAGWDTEPQWVALEMQANGWDNTNQTDSSSPDILDTQVDWVHVWQK